MRNASRRRTSACAPGPDPQWNVNNSILTGLFRNPLTNRPEERMLGNMFGGETFNSDYIVQTKVDEFNAYHGEVSQWEVDRYLTAF